MLVGAVPNNGTSRVRKNIAVVKGAIYSTMGVGRIGGLKRYIMDAASCTPIALHAREVRDLVS